MTVYIVSDLITDHPTCLGWRGPGHRNGHYVGESYWRPQAVLNSAVRAKKFAAPDSIITKHDDDDALEIYRAKRLPDDLGVAK